MTCCLTATSHSLNQYWLITSEVQYQSSDKNSTGHTSAVYYSHYHESYLSKMSSKSPRGQWANVKEKLTNGAPVAPPLDLKKKQQISPNRWAVRCLEIWPGETPGAKQYKTLLFAPDGVVGRGMFVHVSTRTSHKSYKAFPHIFYQNSSWTDLKLGGFICRVWALFPSSDWFPP